MRLGVNGQQDEIEFGCDSANEDIARRNRAAVIHEVFTDDFGRHCACQLCPKAGTDFAKAAQSVADLSQNRMDHDRSSARCRGAVLQAV